VKEMCVHRATPELIQELKHHQGCQLKTIESSTIIIDTDLHLHQVALHRVVRQTMMTTIQRIHLILKIQAPRTVRAATSHQGLEAVGPEDARRDIQKAIQDANLVGQEVTQAAEKQTKQSINWPKR
jgi:hypothetical protein